MSESIMPAATIAAPAEVVANTPPRGRTSPLIIGLLLALLAFTGVVIATAMTRTSTTFDEIVLIAGGARGWETGSFELAPDHPPLMQYVYGLLPHLAGASYPDESGVPPDFRANSGYRYWYAQQFFWRAGNNPETMAFLGRLPAVGIALLLIFLTFHFVRKYFDAATGLFAAALVAFLPDVLAHGGVSYNDVPLALTYSLALWSIDSAVRWPTPRRGVVAGLAIALALGIKISAIALAPAAVLVLVAEAAIRRRDIAWRRAVAVATAATLAALYVGLVAVYRGDVALTQLRFALDFTFRHVSQGHGAAGFLLGDLSTTGWWYFFPAAFFFKTSLGLHVLMLIAVWQLTRDRTGIAAALGSPLRAPAIGLAVFAGALLTSNLNIGFRYALPTLPLLCVITAAGVTRAWRVGSPRLRAAIVAATIWLAAFPLSYYPHFLGYISEYGPNRDENSSVLIDSSVDWGQGLLELRSYMYRNRIDAVYLSYFGSALPEGYGIRYLPLNSFFPLSPQPPVVPQPRHVVISATNLRGAYFTADPYARFREIQPDAVLAHSLYVFSVEP